MVGSLPYIEQIPERGITVLTVVTNGYIATNIQQSRADMVPERRESLTVIAVLECALSAGDPRGQHDRAVHEVRAGRYDDF